jgi:Ca-activated chloride channel homolog
LNIEPLVEEILPLPEAGLGALGTSKGNLPLESVDIRAGITGLAAEIDVVQGFRNPFDVPLEATYIFPLPDRAAVTGMRMEAADRVIEGTLKERGQARQEYDEALASGRRAAIAEEDRPDVFTMRVGNIMPGERVTVRLSLSRPLPYEDGWATLRIPLVVAPRYIPGSPLPDRVGDGTAADTDAVPDASRISPPVLLRGFPNPVRLSLSVDIDPAGLELTEIRSSLHEVSLSGRTVTLAPGERLDRDFVLRLRCAVGASCTVTPDGETFTLTVLPPAGSSTRPRDVALVLDRSGSMSGWKMVAARRAAARIVDTLTDVDRFAVFSFDHAVERVFPAGLADATDRNRFRAVEHLAALTARGGTELLEPLSLAVGLLNDSDSDSGRDRVLVLVTDGQVGNEDQILAGLRFNGIRVHTVGIDQAVNAGFLGRLAAAGAGRCELVESEDRLDAAMDHIHRRIAAPVVTGLSLEIPGAASVTPARLGDLFPGVPLVVRGRLDSMPEVVRLEGVTSADCSPWSVSLSPVTGSGTVDTALWARAQLRELEDRYAAQLGGDELERQIIEVSLRFGVLCRFTAYVAVDSRIAADGSPTHRVIQPVELPAGWEEPVAYGPFGAAAGGPAPAGRGSGPRGMARGAAPSAAPRMAQAAPPSVSAPPSVGARPSVDETDEIEVPEFLLSAPSADTRRRGRTAEPGIDVRALVGDELQRLRDAQGSSELERRQLLADLGTRLKVILAGMPEFADLIESLLACDDPAGPRGDRLNELWDRAVRELTGLTDDSRPRRFWSRG